MADVKVSATVVNGIKDSIKLLHVSARNPNTPLPQALACRNRAQELFDQLIELEAARFNSTAKQYKDAIEGVKAATKELKDAANEIDKIIKTIQKAGKLFGEVDKLLKKAVSFL